MSEKNGALPDRLVERAGDVHQQGLSATAYRDESVVDFIIISGAKAVVCGIEDGPILLLRPILLRGIEMLQIVNLLSAW